MSKQMDNIPVQSTHEIRAKKVRDILVQKNIIEKTEDAMVIRYIKDWVFALYNGRNVAGFLKENGEAIVMLLPIVKDPMFDKAAFLAGYRNMKQSNGVYVMYHMQDIDAKTGKEKPEAKPLDIFSVEYFQAWMDIWFYLSEIVIGIWKNRDEKGIYDTVTQDMIDEFTGTKTLRIRDIEFYLKNKQIDKKMFDRTLKIIQGQIITQIGDIRFERVRDEITPEELQSYYKKWYLDKKLYESAIRTLDTVGIMRLKRDKEKDALKQTTKEAIKNTLK